MKRDVLDTIDLVLATAPSMDTDYGHGHDAQECALLGVCWRCTKRDAVDEIRGSGLCQVCIDSLRWEPPEFEPAPAWVCSEFCRCRERLARVCFEALRAEEEEMTMEHPNRRLIFSVCAVVIVCAFLVAALLVIEAMG